MDECNQAVAAAKDISRLGVIDVGTNSTKLEIVDVHGGGRWSSVSFERRVDRLGEGLTERRTLGEAALRRLVDTPLAFRRRCDRRGCDRTVAFGPEALRAARNGRGVARCAARESGVSIRLLTGKEEAWFAYYSARHRFPRAGRSLLLVDVGGGSTEFAAADVNDVSVLSEPLGALALTERYCRQDPVSFSAYAALVSHARGRIARIAERLPDVSGRLIASGGAATTLLAMSADPGVHSVRLGDLKRIERFCATRTVVQRRRLPGLDRDRADIILAGAVVVTSVMRAFRRRVLLVNPGGVREGVIIRLVENAFQWPA